MQIKRPTPVPITMEISLDIPSGRDHFFLKLEGTCLTVITLVNQDEDETEEWQGEVGCVSDLDPTEFLGELQDWLFDTEDAIYGDEDAEEPGTFRYEIPVTNYGYAYRDGADTEMYFIPATDADTVTLNAYTMSDAKTLISCFTEMLRCQDDAKRIKPA